MTPAALQGLHARVLVFATQANELRCRLRHIEQMPEWLRVAIVMAATSPFAGAAALLVCVDALREAAREVALRNLPNQSAALCEAADQVALLASQESRRNV